jgi:hypothetical protein
VSTVSSELAIGNCAKFECESVSRSPSTQKHAINQRVFGLSGNLLEGDLVPGVGETSNHLLDILAEWNDYLEHHVPFYQTPCHEEPEP